MQPTPNPCRENAKISFGIPAKGGVKLSIYDCAGQRVKNLLDAKHSAGYETVVWDCTDSKGNRAANGTYFCKIRTNGQKLTRKLVLVR